MPELTRDEISRLRVPGTYDQFSAMRQTHLFYDYLGLDVVQTMELVRDMLAYREANLEKIISVTPSEKTFIYYILRWMCRGLSFKQACVKLETDCEARSRRKSWMITKTKKGKG